MKVIRYLDELFRFICAKLLNYTNIQRQWHMQTNHIYLYIDMIYMTEHLQILPLIKHKVRACTHTYTGSTFIFIRAVIRKWGLGVLLVYWICSLMYFTLSLSNQEIYPFHLLCQTISVPCVSCLSNREIKLNPADIRPDRPDWVALCEVCESSFDVWQRDKAKICIILNVFEHQQWMLLGCYWYWYW